MRVFALDLEKLVGFLLVGNVYHKTEVGGGASMRLASSLGLARVHSAWRESHEYSAGLVEGNFNLINVV